ncbi:hypothetical protein D9M73_203190 [compost metagenome]
MKQDQHITQQGCIGFGNDQCGFTVADQPLETPPGEAVVLETTVLQFDQGVEVVETGGTQLKVHGGPLIGAKGAAFICPYVSQWDHESGCPSVAENRTRHRSSIVPDRSRGKRTGCLPYHQEWWRGASFYQSETIDLDQA